MRLSISAEEMRRFKTLVKLWQLDRGNVSEPERSCKIRRDLKAVRNPGWQGNPPITDWPAYLVDKDDGMNAAVEHYFLCRCWVGSGTQPAWQQRTMNQLYNTGKALGVTPQHNPNNPTTELTGLQLAAQEMGVQAGEADLKASGKSAPMFAEPPVYW